MKFTFLDFSFIKAYFLVSCLRTICFIKSQKDCFSVFSKMPWFYARPVTCLSWISCIRYRFGQDGCQVRSKLHLFYPFSIELIFHLGQKSIGLILVVISGLYSVPLIYESISLPVPHGLNYCGSYSISKMIPPT